MHRGRSTCERCGTSVPNSRLYGGQFCSAKCAKEQERADRESMEEELERTEPEVSDGTQRTD
jgi:predicted nucleic acid-binding Zn ribbon protein